MLFELLILVLFLFWFKKETFLWFFLPVGLACDFWRLRPLGTTGLCLLLVCGSIWLVTGFHHEK